MSNSNANECQELKNIKYKSTSMKLNLTDDVKYKKSNVIIGDVSNIDEYLEMEMNHNKNEPWVKLDKSIKIKKLDDYAISMVEEYNLSPNEIKTLQTEFASYLERKLFQKVKDVQYDKEKGVIINIPNLNYNKQTKKFIMKRSDKHVSTLKSLGPKKSMTKNTFSVVNDTI
jgi:hypothetical protein